MKARGEPCQTAEEHNMTISVSAKLYKSQEHCDLTLYNYNIKKTKTFKM